ncbi:hypothetical protein [Aquibium oceanicum]|uniref:hypothetical protein n=1 Tax=Aquibium oceanicum TaxID=1670800 RepID=UPI000A677E4B|nr:hypothetical protein [Aquibium oceanicum]
MITFTKKTDLQTPPVDRGENRFEQIREDAKERHKKAATARRLDSQAAEDTKLI